MIKELINEVKNLPERQIKSVADFIGYIREKETEEKILSSKYVVNSVNSSKRSWNKKKADDFISWELIKKKNSI